MYTFNKLLLTDVPEGTKRIIMRPEWQYRINGGYTCITFLKEDQKFEHFNYDDSVEGSGASYRKMAYDGILVSDLAKKLFTAATLRILKERGVEFLGIDDGEDFYNEDDIIHATENADS